MANEYIRKEWAGGTVRTTLNGNINSSATAITLTDGSSFPSGVKPFVLVIDRGTASEEKIICTSRTGNNLTVLQRGYDGSSAQSHTSGAYVEHILDAYTVDQANAISAAMTTQGDIVYKTATGDNTSFGRLAIGTTGYPLVSGGTAPAYQQLGATGLASNSVEAAKVASNVAGDGLSKNGVTLALDVNVDNTTVEIVSDTVRLKDGGVTSAKIANDTIVNADINTAAGITYGKLALSNSILGSDIATTAAIPYSKLSLTGLVVAADFAAGAKPTIICTSSTRPTTGVVEGQLIYETDTDRIYVATATTPTWQLVHGNVSAIGTRTGGLAIANGATSTLTFSAETDPDSILSAGGILTAPHTGLYSCLINVTAATSMSAGIGSSVNLSNGWETALVGSEATVNLVISLPATNTVSWSITNATGASLTYSYSAEFRWLGR
jgi:hypothetical protein